jgi:DNA-binding HxlR family transcriptional regulator
MTHVSPRSPGLDDRTDDQLPELIQQTIDELVRDGLLYDTGLRRNGKVVYAATELGRKVELVMKPRKSNCGGAA